MDVELQILKHLATDAQPTVSFIDICRLISFKHRSKFKTRLLMFVP